MAPILVQANNVITASKIMGI